MKISIFTSNQLRHINLINSISKVAKTCYAIVEGKTIYPGKVDDFFYKSKIMEKYFSNVDKAEKKFFKNNKFINKSVKTKFIKHGDLNFLKREDILEALSSDLYIVFGSSYIKGWLVDFLIKKQAINIHMGLSPYYRGSSCNFWALYDKNPNFVGATIHLLSKGLDSGKILYHALPDKKLKNSFEYTMSSVVSAQKSLVEKIKNRTLFKHIPRDQNAEKQIRYTKKNNFNDKVLRIFYKKQLHLKVTKQQNIDQIKRIKLINPFKI